MVALSKKSASRGKTSGAAKKIAKRSVRQPASSAAEEAVETVSYSTGRRRIPPIPGERCVQMLTIPNRVLKIIQDLADHDSANAEFETRGALYDHATQWFVAQRTGDVFTEYLSPVVTKKTVSTKRTFWINVAIYKKAEALAERDGVRSNRVLYTALIKYLRYKNALL